MKREGRAGIFLMAMLMPMLAHGQVQVQILACAPKEKEAVGPQDKLECEAVSGTKFLQTLGGLYEEGWRLVSAGFFSGNREVLYLEKASAEEKTPSTEGVK